MYDKYDKNLILQNFTLIFYIKPKLSQKRALPQCLLRKAGIFVFCLLSLS